jgi:pyruvate dehydrogenase E2 component (dihydrolipoamide acetyltransferase)
MTEFILPELGENITGGEVVSILISVGDTVSVDQDVLELETDKATITVPSSVGGTVTAIHIKAGDHVEIGQLILSLEGEATDTSSKKEPPPQKETPPPAPPEPPPPPSSSPPSPPKATGPVEFKLPELGENITGGDVVGVLVSVGDSVTTDQDVLELETDKATVTVPCSVSGTVTAIHIKPGDHVEIGQLILTLEGATESKTPIETPVAESTEPVVEPVETPAIEPTETTPVVASSRRDIPGAPNVHRLAREIGIDIAQVPPDPTGRVTIPGLKAYARQIRQTAPVSSPPSTGGEIGEAKPLPDFSKWGEVEIEKMSNIRRATSNQMVYAWSSPHVTQFDKADIVELEGLRKRFGKRLEKDGVKLTVTAILLKITAAALKQFPQFNASVDAANDQVILKKYYHIGVAVDTERGLVVPVIRDVDRKNIFELAIELNQMAQKARDRKLGLDDMQGGTFTISNLGGIGGTNFTPIINAPEVAILGVARGGIEPVYNKESESFEPRLMMPLALSYDHRLIDGAAGARFLRWVCEALENPLMMSLQSW